MSDISDFSQWLSCENPAANVGFDFKVLVSRFAKEIKGYDNIKAEAFAEGRSKNLWNGIKKKNDALKNKGLLPLISTDDDLRMLYSHYVEQDAKTPRSYKLRHRWRVCLWLQEMDWRDYEYTGAFCLSISGGKEVFVSPRGNEGGIDFGGLVNYYGNSTSIHSREYFLRVIGQSKKYNQALPVGKLREMNDVIVAIKKGAREQTAQLPPLFKTQKGPILCWIACHGGFQSGAEDNALKHGTLLSDSLSLAENLTTWKNLTYTKNPEDYLSELEKSF